MKKAGYDSFTVVDQAVQAAAISQEMSFAKGVVNAILRRFLRERGAHAASHQDPPGTWNYPTWWIDRLKGAYPEQWQAILHAGNQPPPLTLRVNRRRASVEQYLSTLQQAGMGARAVGPYAVRLDKPVPVHQIPGFAEGVVSVQDAAAQLAAPLLDVADGMRVLDACAAPGGKTGHLLELAELDLQALDHDPRRLQRIAENLDRLQLKAALKTATPVKTAGGMARASTASWPTCPVPPRASCAPPGYPLAAPQDRHRAACNTFRANFGQAWQMLRPDGKLLLVTCSLWPQESEQQAIAFAQKNNAIRLPAPGQLLPAGADADHDGLFYALFQKPGA
jgi:16S rRNA (cytosine967-C5)-methyltransferase